MILYHLIFYELMSSFTILKERNKFLLFVDENRAERKNINPLISCPTQTFFLCLLFGLLM